MRTFFLTFSIYFFISVSAFAQLTRVAGEFNGVSGIETDEQGNVWVTETGSGANDGQVVRIDENGNKVVVVASLPSLVEPASGDTAGPWRSILLPNNRLAVLVGEGPNPPFGSILLYDLNGFEFGISPSKTLADTTSTIEISSFALAQSDVTNSNPYSAVLDSDGTWYVADAGANMVIKITPDGTRSVFARFDRIPNPTPIGPPVIDPVPTRIIANPDGGFFVCTLTGFPFLEGLATVYSLDKNGKLTPYASGFTMLTDLVFDDKTGDIFAMQFGNFAFAPQPGFVFGSAKVHRIQRGGLFSEVVASDFGPGAGLTLDNAGNLFMTSLFTGELLTLDRPSCDEIEIAVTADKDVLSIYTPIRYTLKVTNTGASDASNVRVFWLPSYKRFPGDAQPFAYQTSGVSTGNFDWWRGYWTINKLAAGESATAYYDLYVLNDEQDVTQSAQVAACNQRSAATSGENPKKVSLVTLANQHTSTPVFRLSQNPADSRLAIYVDNPSEDAWTLRLMNTLGQTVFQQVGQQNQMLEIDASHLENGVYVVEYQAGMLRKTEKLIIQH